MQSLTDSWDWARRRQRYEAWWRGELDSPLLQVTAPRGPAEAETPPTDPAGLLRWFTDPDCVIPRLERQLEATFFAGDAFPLAFPVSGSLAAIQAAYLGCPYQIAPDSLSGWSEPIWLDGQAAPSLEMDWENIWWQHTQRLLAAGAQASRGRYAVGLPDLQGGGEILAQLRGAENLARDLYDAPEQVLPAIEAINRAWLRCYQACFAILHPATSGYVDWLGIWSETPAVTVECDFSVMVSPRMFRRFFLPAVEQQIAWVGRAVFHLDGPGELPHLEMLLALEGLRAIQWVPLPGQSQVEWLPLLQKIQAAGKGLALACQPEEVKVLCAELQPGGLLLSTSCPSVEAAARLVDEILPRRGDGFHSPV